MRFNKRLINFHIIILMFMLPIFIIGVNSNEDTWTRRWDNAVDYVTDIAIDSQNNLYLVGSTYDSGDSIKKGVCLLKFNRTGDLVWDFIWDLGKNVIASQIAIDKENNLYIAGTKDTDAFLMKCDVEGNILWNKTWGGTYRETCGGLVIDSLNNSYIFGNTESFGVGWLEGDIFITKFNSSGSKLWNFTWGTSETENFNAVTIDSVNNLYVAGEMIYDPYKRFIVKFNSSGTEIWNKTTSISSHQDLMTDAEDNIVYANERNLIKFNSSGDIIWSQNLTRSIFWSELVIDSSSNIYSAETRINQCPPDYLYFNGISSCICFAIYLDKYDSLGNLIWEKRCTGCTDSTCGGVALDTSDNIYICGTSRDGGCGMTNDIILMKNPKNFSGLCLEIYIDVLIIVLAIIGICIFLLFRYRKKKRSGLVEVIT